jgi:hypothetical protein
MLGINYESSDEEEAVAPKPDLASKKDDTTSIQPQKPSDAPPHVEHVEVPPEKEEVPSAAHISENTSGPALGPTRGPVAQPNVEESERLQDIARPEPSQPSSRQAIHEFTYPLNRNHEIPPSPPGSPAPGSTAKFEKWLEHKKKGLHFNQKLQSNSGFHNPGYLQSSLKKLGLTQEDEYGSTLPPDVAVPAIFPEWAYVEQLTESQKKITKEREAKIAKGQRSAVEFVPASSESQAPKNSQRRGGRHPQSIAERVLGERA